ncbi:MAG: hypothetical protein ABEJ44_08110 [Halanaeroarchaeum sp.]
MSLPSTPSVPTVSRLRDSLSGAVTGYEVLLRPIEAVAFWAAVVMPFVYVPLLLAGVETSAERVAVAALVAVHVVVLIVGRRYSPHR